MEIQNNEKITLADATELDITLNPKDLDGPVTLVYIEVITTTTGVRFASGVTIDNAKHYARPAGNIFPMRYKERTSTIKAKGAAGDVIVFSW